MTDIGRTNTADVTRHEFYIPRYRIERLDCQRCKSMAEANEMGDLSKPPTTRKQARVAFWTVAGEQDARHVFMHVLCKVCAEIPIHLLHHARELDYSDRLFQQRNVKFNKGPKRDQITGNGMFPSFDKGDNQSQHFVKDNLVAT